ncbi:NAD(P)/FAD-dependent oxidoreductase [Ravibacter arvi]|uniref:NAD(P)/FAD-dependent oxidoreductase n=1 Tax=Ravibacter arvi TaxID=2051041 RepID=A0ABP8M8B2_9BACT
MAGEAYKAIVVGSGPNGLAAAITLQRAGHSVLVLEGMDTIGGGTRTQALTLPGFHHDVCSAVHPMGAISPFFNTLPLDRHGLEWLYPEVSAAHPFDDGTAAALYPSLAQTARGLGVDEKAYHRFMEPVIKALPQLLPGLLSAFPGFSHPFLLADFARRALPPALRTARRFATEPTRGLWAGMAAHAMLPLEKSMTSAIGMMLMAASHLGGWPVARGGSISIGNALAAYFLSIGGTIQTGFFVKSLADLPPAKAILFDVTPRQLLEIAGASLPAGYRKRLAAYRYGMGVFKIDWAVEGPVPFRAPVCRKAVTVHLGGGIREIARSESAAWSGQVPESPFVLLTQPGVVDSSRAPAGKQVVWGYCHVPHSSGHDMTEAIERQVERFAPGFRDSILAKSVMSAVDMQAYNPNYVGGDINGGVQDIFQHFARPVLSFSPYRTPAKGIYFCSSSTPPGGGVHGMCGFHAAERVLKDGILDRV